MRKIFAVAALFLAINSYASVSVSGNLQDLTGTAVTSRTFVRFIIRGCAGNQARFTGTASLTPNYEDFTPDVAGAFSGTLYDSLAEISCGGSVGNTWYGVVIYRDGKPGPEVPYNVTGASFNLNSATPNATSPVVSAPTGDSTYLRLDGGNTMAGNILPDTNGTRPLGSTSARWDLFANAIDSDSFVKLRASTAPTCLASIGFIWYDTSANRLKFCDNGGSAFQLFKSTDYGNATWGSGSGFTWTFDASAGTDNTFIFGNDTLAMNAATVTLGTASGGVVVTTPAGSGAGSGGSATYRAGDGGATGVGGLLTLFSGAGGGGNATGGDVTLQSGAGSGSGTAGGISITVGAAGSTANGNNLNLFAGSGGATSGLGGAVNIAGGAAQGGNNDGGDVQLSPGAKAGSGKVGRVLIVGSAGTGNLSQSDQAAVYYDTTADKLELSLNAGSFFPIPQVVASGTSTMTSGALGSGSCNTAVTTTATGTATTDTIVWSYASAPAAADGKLNLSPYPTANNVNFLVCNASGASQTATGLVVNWRVIR